MTGGWKDVQADALDAQAAELEVVLEQLDVVHEVLEQRGTVALAGELWSFAGGLRAERDVMRSEARALRATHAGNGRPALTVYHQRRPALSPAPVRDEEATDD